MDPQETSQGRPHILFSIILFYLKSCSVISLIDMPIFYYLY